MISWLRDDPAGPAVVRVLAGTGSAADQAECQHWLASDPERVRQFGELRALWRTAGTLQGPWDTAALQRRILRTASAGADAPHAFTAASASRNGEAARSLVLGSAVAASRSRAWFPAAAAAIVVIACGVVGWWIWGQRSRLAGSRGGMAEVAAQPIGETNFLLPDGTRGLLRTKSRLRFARAMATGQSRDVYLEGEGYFEVAHDSAHPFLVHAGPVVARVLGTRFGVRAYTADTLVQVVVAEGKVGVGRGTTIEAVLERGDFAALGARGRIVVRRGVDLSRYLGWIEKSGTVLLSFKVTAEERPMYRLSDPPVAGDTPATPRVHQPSARGPLAPPASKEEPPVNVSIEAGVIWNDPNTQQAMLRTVDGRVLVMGSPEEQAYEKNYLEPKLAAAIKAARAAQRPRPGK